MGLLNLNFGSTKKNDNDGLDPESQQLIDAASVESMHQDLNPEKNKIETPQKTGTLKTIPTSKEANPFLVEDTKAEPIVEEASKQEVEIDLPATPIVEEINEPEIKIDLPTAPIIENDDKIKAEINLSAEPIQLSSEEEDISKKPEKKSSAGKIVALILSILIILGLAGGGYYFFILKDTPKIVPVEPEMIIPEIVSPEIPEILQGNPKYLNLDFQETASTEDAIAKMGQYISEFKASEEIRATEYVISDLNNNPIGFKTFTARLGLTIPTPIASLIEDEMRFFLNNDNGNPGIGIILKSKDDTLLNVELAKAEPILIEYAKALIPSVEIPTETVDFKESVYKKIEKKYYNVTSPIELSIDYMISENNLYIGTTRRTSQTIYDLVEEEVPIVEEVAEAEKTIIVADEAIIAEETPTTPEIPDFPTASGL